MGRDRVVENKRNGHKCSMVKRDKGDRNKREETGVKRKVAGGEGNHGYISEPGGDIGEGSGFDTEV